MASKYAANKSESEGDRDLVFGNRMCKNTLARGADLVLLIRRVQFGTVLLGFYH